MIHPPSLVIHVTFLVDPQPGSTYDLTWINRGWAAVGDQTAAARRWTLSW